MNQGLTCFPTAGAGVVQNGAICSRTVQFVLLGSGNGGATRHQDMGHRYYAPLTIVLSTPETDRLGVCTAVCVAPSSGFRFEEDREAKSSRALVADLGLRSRQRRGIDERVNDPRR